MFFLHNINLCLSCFSRGRTGECTNTRVWQWEIETCFWMEIQQCLSYIREFEAEFAWDLGCFRLRCTSSIHRLLKKFRIYWPIITPFILHTVQNVWRKITGSFWLVPEIRRYFVGFKVTFNLNLFSASLLFLRIVLRVFLKSFLAIAIVLCLFL